MNSTYEAPAARNAFNRRGRGENCTQRSQRNTIKLIQNKVFVFLCVLCVYL